MKLHSFILIPTSPFGTSLKGDTIFGHFCWQAAMDDFILDGGLKRWIEMYPERPFAVFSSAFPSITAKGERSYALAKPNLPFTLLFPDELQKSRIELLKQRKEFKKRKWLLSGKDLYLDLSGGEYLTDKELMKLHLDALPSHIRRDTRMSETESIMAKLMQTHNKINRMTMTTGEGFAPYSLETIHFFPGMELALFILYDEEATSPDKIFAGLERIGKWGFGRDASSGLGRFVIKDDGPLNEPEIKCANALYTIAPSVPEKDRFLKVFFKTFVRFGKHGDAAVLSGLPFKCPVVMADEGAVLIPKDKTNMDKLWLGSVVTGISKAMDKTMTQGYSICLPCHLEGL